MFKFSLNTFPHFLHSQLFETDNYDIANKEYTYSEFMLIKNGCMEIEINDVKFTAEKGAFIIIPKGSIVNFKTLETSDKLIFYTIGFFGTIELSFTDLKHYLTSTPTVICKYHQYPKNFDELCNLFDECSTAFHSNNLALTFGYFFTIFSLYNTDFSLANLKSTAYFARKIKEYIQVNYEKKITISNIAKELSVSEGYASTIFKKNENMTIVEYLTYYRIERAKELMVNTDYSIDKIAQSTGFGSQQYFTRVFKKHTNVTPSKYRTRIKGKFLPY